LTVLLSPVELELRLKADSDEGLGNGLAISERRERAVLERRCRMTGSDKFAIAFCVRSKAAAASERIPLGDRWILDDEDVRAEGWPERV
jgi:hypothetical protein